MVRVFLCGVGGAGKTTLAEKLTGKKELRRFQRIKEVARKVMEEEQIRKADLERDDRTYLKLQELVMDAQRSEEARCGLDLISDRSVLDSLTYTYMRRGWNYTENLIAQKKVSSTFHQAKEYLRAENILTTGYCGTFGGTVPALTCGPGSSLVCVCVCVSCH